MVILNPLRRVKHWLRAPLCEQHFLFARDQQIALSRSHSPLEAFDGLFIASLFSILFWSVLTFALFHHR